MSKRNQETNDIKPQKINSKNAVEVFCGNDHSFYINKDHHVYAWGHNNHGQLGIGSKENTPQPTRIKELDPYEGDYIVQIEGGEHHSIARTKDGAVYCWGNNEEGQLGIGDTYGEYRKEKAKAEKDELEKQNLQQEQKPVDEGQIPEGGDDQAA